MEHRIVVRTVQPGDLAAWRVMRTSLWPESGAGAADEVATFFGDGLIDGVPHVVFVAAMRSDAGPIVGFIEMSMHDAVPGHSGGPVGFIEGWWVHENCRRHGVGRALLRSAEGAARSMGATAMGSDTDAAHAALSVPAHERCGFRRVHPAGGGVDPPICFLKALDPR